MSTYSASARLDDLFSGLKAGVRRAARGLRFGRGSLFVWMIVGALISFEAFNYGTTEFALTDLLGDLQFAGMRWSTILALAFCGMDFAGIARLFTPQRGEQEPIEVWYLLGAWFLAATMNAMLTWWAVSLALINHQGLGNEVIGREALLSGAPIFVAVLVWLIRVLIIGSFTLAGERAMEWGASSAANYNRQRSRSTSASSRKSVGAIRPAPKPVPKREPEYADARSGNGMRRAGT
jgi:hypothetical protein